MSDQVDTAWQPSQVQRERDEWRRSRTLRSAAIAAGSTLLLLGAMGGAVVRSPGWDRVQETYFDWDKAVLTPEGRRVVADAAQAFQTSGRSTIVATGYTDLSGPPAYNYKLSERRAAAVKAELVRLGIPATAITTIGRGENDPLVPTADGVREPQNRRVEIQMQQQQMQRPGM